MQPSLPDLVGGSAERFIDAAPWPQRLPRWLDPFHLLSGFQKPLIVSTRLDLAEAVVRLNLLTVPTMSWRRLNPFRDEPFVGTVDDTGGRLTITSGARTGPAGRELIFAWDRTERGLVLRGILSLVPAHWLYFCVSIAAMSLLTAWELCTLVLDHAPLLAYLRPLANLPAVYLFLSAYVRVGLWIGKTREARFVQIVTEALQSKKRITRA